MNIFRSAFLCTITFLLHAFFSSLQSTQSATHPAGWVETYIYDPQEKTCKTIYMPPQDKITLNVAFDNTNQSESSASAHPNASTSAHPQLQEKQPSLSLLPKSKTDNAAINQCSKWNDYIFNKYSFSLGCGVTLTAYLTLYYKFKKALWLLEDENAWCNWKGDVPLEDLFNLSRYELAEELLKKIQTKYLNAKNPTDHIAPLNVFLESYGNEIKTFQKHFKLVKWIKRFRLTRIFPVSRQNMEKMKNKIQRLSYLKTVFFSWMTEYKTSRCKIIKKEEAPKEPLPF
jgi:hypothetical protein